MNFTKIRKLYVKKIILILSKNELVISQKREDADIMKLAKNVEKEILRVSHYECNHYGELIMKAPQNEQYSNNFIKLYENNIRTLLINLDKNNYVSNDNLMNNLLDGTFTPKQISEHIVECPQILFPNRNKKYFDYIEKQEEVAYDKSKLAIESEYKCRKCKENKCAVNQAQLRSADEPMSILITCLNCGNRWRIN